jgi:hypothetical protein
MCAVVLNVLAGYFITLGTPKYQAIFKASHNINHSLDETVSKESKKEVEERRETEKATKNANDSMKYVRTQAFVSFFCFSPKLGSKLRS